VAWPGLGGGVIAKQAAGTKCPAQLWSQLNFLLFGGGATHLAAAPSMWASKWQKSKYFRKQKTDLLVSCVPVSSTDCQIFII